MIASVFAAVSLQAQTVVYVAPDTGVKVKPNTLFYVGGDMKVANYTNSVKKVSNEGKVKITKKLINSNNDGSNFVNEFPKTGEYGQLIINSNTSENNVGDITSVVRFNSNFNFQTIAIPYTGVTTESFVKEVFGLEESDDISNAFISHSGNGKFVRNRYKNPLFYWNNETYTLDNLAQSDDLKGPEKEYAVSSFSKLGDLQTALKTKLSGTPHKDNLSVTVTGYVPGPTNKTTNKYGEYYGSYIFDFTKTIEKSKGWGDYKQPGDGVDNTVDKYGANIYHFGNPYTSNIDLSKGVGFTGVGASIYQFQSNNYVEGTSPGQRISYSPITAATGEGAGDPAQYVRPFQSFYIKLPDLAKGSTHQFMFKNEMKTFNLPNNTVSNVLFTKNSSLRPIINQVGLDLYDTNGFTGVKTYVVASDIYDAAQQGVGAEVYNVSMSDKDTGIYTLQENEDGTINEQLSVGKTYINGVNADKYVAKPIHVVFQNGKGQYTLKARLNESLENNKNAFYFEDKSTGKIQKVTKDFEYTFNVNGTEKDRFVLYWAATPNQEKVEEVAKQEVSSTVVFKDADTYKVRFDKGIKKADVFVYNISGQLVNTARNIDASVDYIVPLRGNSSVYIVKVVGDNGQVTTKKIIK